MNAKTKRQIKWQLWRLNRFQRVVYDGIFTLYLRHVHSDHKKAHQAAWKMATQI